jgi:hypothetical protein
MNRKDIAKIWSDPDHTRDDIDRFARTFRTLREAFRGHPQEQKLLQFLRSELLVEVRLKY